MTSVYLDKTGPDSSDPFSYIRIDFTIDYEFDEFNQLPTFYLVAETVDKKHKTERWNFIRVDARDIANFISDI